MHFYAAHNVLFTPLPFQFYFPPPPPPPHLFYIFFHPQIHLPPSALSRPHITTTISIVFPPPPPPPPPHFYCLSLHHHHRLISFVSLLLLLLLLLFPSSSFLLFSLEKAKEVKIRPSHLGFAFQAWFWPFDLFEGKQQKCGGGGETIKKKEIRIRIIRILIRRFTNCQPEVNCILRVQKISARVIQYGNNQDTEMRTRDSMPFKTKRTAPWLPT